jgi:hypothetical protein
MVVVKRLSFKPHFYFLALFSDQGRSAFFTEQDPHPVLG